MFFARQIRSAPVPDACFHNAIPVNPRSASSTMPGSKRSTSTFDNANSEVPYGPSSASKIAWVPHSASATRRAWGRGPLPLGHTGTPKELVVRNGVRHVEGGAIDRHKTTARQPRTWRVRLCQRSRDLIEQRLHRLRPEAFALGRSQTSTATPPAHPPRPPTPTRRSSTTTHPDTNPRSATPNPSRNTPSFELATTGSAARCDRTPQSPHRQPPAGTPAPTTPQTPDPATVYAFQVYANQLEPSIQTTPM